MLWWEDGMTGFVSIEIIKIIGMIVTIVMVCFLAGMTYNVFVVKKKRGIASTCLSGLVFLLFYLFIIQILCIKLDWSFQTLTRRYTAFFIAFILFGFAAIIVGFARKNKIRLDIIWSKKAFLLYGLILLQGILYIGLKNPYFENNGLLETSRIILDTNTIYDYSAFSQKEAVAGFPLSNKLMIIPQLYAYLANLFAIDVYAIYNYVAPILTFVGYYTAMFLCVQKIGKSHNIKWQRLMLSVILLTQLGDYWMHTTSFRVLHSGYMGEAVLFGVIVPYLIYEIKNKCYFIVAFSVFSVPILIKYDAVFDFIKGFLGYFGQATYHGGMLILYVIAVVYLIVKFRKIKIYLLNVNLTIATMICMLWEYVLGLKQSKMFKMASGVLIVALLVLAGNVTILSDATQWRSNKYGVDKEEYEVLIEISKTATEDETLNVMAYSALNKWIARMDLPIVPIVGHDMDTTEVSWYSYEQYDENYTRLWENVNYVTNDLEAELLSILEEIPMDYVVLKNETDILPIRDNERIKYYFQTPSYTVYLVDKK